MDLSNDLLPSDYAEVTRMGIKFNGRFYSCSLAMREQWFLKASLNAEWKVSVFYDSLDTNYLLISHQNACLSIAHRISKTAAVDPLKIQEYYEQINLLKKRIKTRKRGRKLHD